MCRRSETESKGKENMEDVGGVWVCGHVKIYTFLNDTLEVKGIPHGGDRKI